MGSMHPALFIFLGAILAGLLHGTARKVALLAATGLAFLNVGMLETGTYGAVSWLGFHLVFMEVDKLAIVFLHVFTLMAFIGAVYSLHVEDRWQHVAGLLYVGGSLGVTLAGDYLTLFVFWELMAFASAFLVFLRRKPESLRAGFRYLLVHTLGGLILMGGIFLMWLITRDLTFSIFDRDAIAAAVEAGKYGFIDQAWALKLVPWAFYLIMIGFALNAAVPPIHAWLPDAYPEATVTGAVFMCAFTTKTAVYVLLRAFPGAEVLAIAGAIMTLYGVGYAIIENDARRILAYHIVSQVGYMVCGIGMAAIMVNGHLLPPDSGAVLAFNGTVAHAYAHILYKALLFMGVGAVLEMTGTCKLSELGGLYKRMPLTMIFTVIGGISISGFPFTSGFISKSMIIAGAGGSHHLVLMIMLLLASVGTFLSVGIKLPYFLFFGKDSGVPAKEPPQNMLWAMGIAAFFCFFLGVYPEYLYKMLPFEATYHPYSAYHFSETIQILGFTGLGFYLLRKKLTPEAKLNLDVDWLYRRGTPYLITFARNVLAPIDGWWSERYKVVGMRFALWFAALWSVFDVKAIDGVVDGTALGVRAIGGEVRKIQSGRLQQYIAMAVAALFAVLALVVQF
ncbi:MAG: Na(+)/H(+) antiporter subunit D [Deferrisomatales bacterium]|nr:Na(+)/H(+) antiporter subunit D [Deferrisomatales bacterium]